MRRSLETPKRKGRQDDQDGIRPPAISPPSSPQTCASRKHCWTLKSSSTTSVVASGQLKEFDLQGWRVKKLGANSSRSILKNITDASKLRSR